MYLMAYLYKFHVSYLYTIKFKLLFLVIMYLYDFTAKFDIDHNRFAIMNHHIQYISNCSKHSFLQICLITRL